MIDRPRLRGDLLAERSDGIVEMMPPDGDRVLQLFEVEAAVACGMDGTRDPAALVVWAKMELGLVTTEAQIAAVVAALAGAGCLAEGDDAFATASPFDAVTPARPPSRVDVVQQLSAEIPIEDMELPEPGPGLEALYGDEIEDPAERERQPTAVMSMPEFEGERATAVGELPEFGDEEPTPPTQPQGEATRVAPPPQAPLAPRVPPQRNTPRGYAAAAVSAPSSENQTRIVPAGVMTSWAEASAKPASTPAAASSTPAAPASTPAASRCTCIGCQRTGTGCQRTGTGCQRTCTGCQRTGTGFPCTGTGCQRTGTGFPCTGTGCPLTSTGFP